MVTETSGLPFQNHVNRCGWSGRVGTHGIIHALHIHELARETDQCRLSAVATQDKKAGEAFLKMTAAGRRCSKTLGNSQSRVCAM